MATEEPIESAPVDVASVDVAPVDVAPVAEAAPMEVEPVAAPAESAPVDIAPVEAPAEAAVAPTEEFTAVDESMASEVTQAEDDMSDLATTTVTPEVEPIPTPALPEVSQVADTGDLTNVEVLT